MGVRWKACQPAYHYSRSIYVGGTAMCTSD
nr:MAG TPA: hypothetical protein [Caudoviricetes sp.]